MIAYVFPADVVELVIFIQIRYHCTLKLHQSLTTYLSTFRIKQTQRETMAKKSGKNRKGGKKPIMQSTGQ
jgi:hypothetical protein